MARACHFYSYNLKKLLTDRRPCIFSQGSIGRVFLTRPMTCRLNQCFLTFPSRRANRFARRLFRARARMSAGRTERRRGRPQGVAGSNNTNFVYFHKILPRGAQNFGGIKLFFSAKILYKPVVFDIMVHKRLTARAGEPPFTSKEGSAAFGTGPCGA